MRKLWTPHGYVPVRAVGLDVDGVMRDTGHNAYRSLCEVLKLKGGKVPTYGEYLARDMRTVDFCAEQGVTISAEELDELYFDIHPPDHLTAPFRDVTGFCEDAGALGLDLFVVSAARSDWIVDWFEQHSLGVHFGQVIHQSGPKHLHLSRICEELGAEPESMVYVGDRGIDMVHARKANAVPVGITRGYHGAEEGLRRCGATMVVHSLEHLAHLIS